MLIFGLSIAFMRLVAFTWDDKYGTGSDPGSPRGQPAWGGGSDRVKESTQARKGK